MCACLDKLAQFLNAIARDICASKRQTESEPAEYHLRLSAEPTGPSLSSLTFPPLHLMRDRRRLPYTILTTRISRTTDSNPNLLIALPAPQALIAPRIHIAASFINGFDLCPNALFLFAWRHGIQRNAAARRCGRGRDAFERGRRSGTAARVAVRGYFLAEEDAQDGDGSANDSDGGFNGGPDRDVFAVVEEVGLPQLDHVDAFYDCANTGSVLLLMYGWQRGR